MVHEPLSLKILIFQLLLCWNFITGCFTYTCIIMFLSLTVFARVIVIIFNKVCYACTSVYLIRKVRCAVRCMVLYSRALPLVILFRLLGGNQLCGTVADRHALCYGDVLVSVIHEGLLFLQALRSFLFPPPQSKIQEQYFKICHGHVPGILPFITVQKQPLIKLLR